MQVVIGLYPRSTSKEEHQRFLTEMASTLRGYHLPVNAISSKKDTGGAVIVEVPDSHELHEITRSLASFAEDLARQAGADVSFPLSIPAYGFSVTIAGAA